MSKVGKKQLIWIIFGVFVLFSFLGQFSARAATFVGVFSNTAYKDATNTTAEWEQNTSSGHLINGAWRKADNTAGPTYETLPGVMADVFDITADGNNQPVVVFSVATTFYSMKWTVGAGTDVCGGSATDCWTNLAGTSTDFDNISLASNFLRIKVLKLASGYPAIAAISNGSTDALYYSQYTPGFGWTHANGNTAGLELISSSGADVSSKNYDFQLDNFNQPTIMWKEKIGSGTPYTLNLRYTRLNNGVWKHADRTTTGQEDVISASGNSMFDSLDFKYAVNGDLYFISRLEDNSNYLGRWNGSNWTDLDENNFASVPGNSDDLTLFDSGNRPALAINSSNEVYAAANSSIPEQIVVAKRVSGAWKYPDGTTNGIETVSYLTSDYLTGIKVDSDNTFQIYISAQDSTTNDDELYFTQWKNSAWTKADGQTNGWEQISSLVNGSYLRTSYSNNQFDLPLAFDGNDYPIFVYTNMSGSPQITYLSRYTGTNFKGANEITNAQDTVFPSGVTAWAASVYFEPNTQNIFVLSQQTSTALSFTKFNNNLYPTSNQNLVSTKIATAYSGTNISKATLSVLDNKPSNTGITYYLSADGGANWETVTPGTEHDFTNVGADLRWKANLTTSNINNSPTVSYFYINVDAKTELTAGDVNINATVDPSLSYSFSSNSCTLGTLDTTKIKTCGYSATVNTNAVNGYTSYVREDGDFQNGSNSFTNVSDGFVTVGHEEYGVATSAANYASLQINKQVTDCSGLNDTTSPINSVEVTTSDQSFAHASGPVADDTVTLCHMVAISYATKPGSYHQTVTVTFVSNF